MQSINLLPTQTDHVQKLQDILNKSPFALDFSMLGTGKTFTSSYIAKDRNLKVIVIAPVSVCTKWEYMKTTYGVNVIKNLSFCSVRSIKNRQPKHGLLHRKDYKSVFRNMEVDKVDFTPTEFYKQLVEEGVLLVIDEIQNIKNINIQFFAVKALIEEIVKGYKNKSRSRVIMLSGSPFDKKEQATALFRSLGIMHRDELGLYDIATRNMTWTGLYDIEKYCMRINNTQTTSIRNSMIIEKTKDGYEFVYKLFQNILKPYVSSFMLPGSNDKKLFKYNAIYDVHDKSEIKLLIDSVDLLSRSVRKILEENQSISALNGITTALVGIETSKIGTFVRIVQKHLNENKNKKIVICVNYKKTIESLRIKLKEFTPIILDGSCNAKLRQQILSKFQKNDSEYRLLICNLEVCSTGIDLDDKDGNYPRMVLVSPNYRTISLYQLCHRFLRADTKSDSLIHFVFGQPAVELKMLNTLARKSTVMKETTTEQLEMGVVFPGDFDEWFESDDQNITIKTDDCGICLDTLNSLDKILTLECGHQYHKKCAEKWFDINNTCPHCRKIQMYKCIEKH